MAYRFTDTNKWADEWFVDLTPMQKLMFMYLCDNCDIAGFYELSLRKLTFDLGVNDSEIKGALKGLERGFILSTDKRVLFLKNFIKHQKNLPLNEKNKAHSGILGRFANYKNKFDVDLLHFVHSGEIIKGEAPSKPLLRGSGNGNNYITIIEENKGVDFENFWNLYDKKVGDKKKCEKKWRKLSISTQQNIIQVLPEWMKQFSSKQFQPYPETFINQERWNDEVSPLSVAHVASATNQSGIPTIVPQELYQKPAMVY